MDKIGRYTVERQLACGDMARVFACRTGESRCALMLFDPQENVIAALMARFDHPNIVPVRDMEPTDAERPY